MAKDTAANQPPRLPAHLRDDLKWKPGQSGNPAGRPKGARSILQEDFFRELQKSFKKNGAEVLEIMRVEKPNEYARMIASLMSKEITGEDGAPLFPTRVESIIVDPAN